MNDRYTRYRYVVGIDLSRHTTRYLDLDRIQSEIIEWQTRNFGEGPTVHPLLGMVEETGELVKALPEDPHQALSYFLGALAHAVLKDEQGIRGTHEEHVVAARDSLGDFCVYAMAYCAKRGWRLSDIIEETWLHVQKRDWTQNKHDGSNAIVETPGIGGVGEMK